MPETVDWGLTRLYQEANEACFLLMHACLGQLGTVLGGPLSTCLLDQAPLRGASRNLVGIYFLSQPKKALPSEINQVIAMT
jgi:hypothetical protein